MASAGSLIIWQWQWSRGDRLESAPTNQPNHEELKPYRYCPIIQFLAQASTGKTKSDVRRAKSDENEQKRRCQAKIFFMCSVLLGLFFKIPFKFIRYLKRLLSFLFSA
jgi:hypothetical protein